MILQVWIMKPLKKSLIKKADFSTHTKLESPVIQSGLFGMVKWPILGLSDLQLGDEKVTPWFGYLRFLGAHLPLHPISGQEAPPQCQDWPRKLRNRGGFSLNKFLFLGGICGHQQPSNPCMIIWFFAISTWKAVPIFDLAGASCLV